MSRALRLSPPATGRAIVERRRLLGVVGQRWERRVVALTAGAGFGKTTLLARAIAENRAAPRGDDVWLMCEPDDAGAEHLATGLLAAVGVAEPAAVIEADDDVARVVTDAMWRRAPRQVCLVLDDVHEIPADSESARLLQSVVEHLPANGHVVLAARHSVPIALHRLDAHGEVVRLGTDELGFDDAELADFAELRAVDAERLRGVGGWPALVELAASTHRDAVEGFLFEEVLARLEPSDRRLLAVLGLVGEADQALVETLVPGARRLSDVLAAVPLAQSDDDGWWSLHPLWHDALASHLNADERRETLRRAGLARLDSSPATAIRLLVRSSDEAAIRLAIRTSLRAYWVASPGRLLELHADLPEAVRSAPDGALLHAVATAATNPSIAERLLRHTAERFEALDDVDGALLAFEHLAVLAHRREDPIALFEVFPQIERLGEHRGSEAPALVTLGEALVADASGDAQAVLAALDRLDPTALRRYWHAPIAWLRGQATLALGHPEAALPDIERAIAAGPPAFRGEAGMLHVNALAHAGRTTEALALIEPVVTRVTASGATHAMVLAHGQAAQRYALAGQLVSARSHAAAAHDLAGPAPSAPMRANLVAADALVAVAAGDEDAAIALLRGALDDHTLDAGRQQYAHRRRLPLFYVLVPETRELWDTADLGPAFVAARDLARALVAVRDDATCAPAAALGGDHWRVAPAYLPVPWLIELALAGSAGGSESASRVVTSLESTARPVIREISRRATVPAVARAARDALASIVRIPDAPLTLSVLGPLELWRGGVRVDTADWRRERVRSLLSYLVCRRRATRDEVAAALWPDLDGDASDRNLRVTLTYLHSVLEPHRSSGDPPYFVRTDGGLLQLVDSEHLTVDAKRFETLLDEAARAEPGSPLEALRLLRDAVALYRGGLLAELAYEEWVLPERRRLCARFVGAAVRAGELALAAGDPAEALVLASRAIAEEPWSEPAHRLLAAAHLDNGDRAAARRALDACAAMLAELGATAEEETAILARRVA